MTNQEGGKLSDTCRLSDAAVKPLEGTLECIPARSANQLLSLLAGKVSLGDGAAFVCLVYGVHTGVAGAKVPPLHREGKIALRGLSWRIPTLTAS